MFDDRLATVLRTRAESAAGEHTQFRQLLDLLGTAPANGELSETLSTAYTRLAQLSDTIPAQIQSHILRESGLRIRNPRLVSLLAEAEPKTAASAMATARLSESQWEAIIPTLPVIARGFLRHRRDLPAGAVQMLKRLGIGDLTLPDPNSGARPPVAEQAPRVELAKKAPPPAIVDPLPATNIAAPSPISPAPVSPAASEPAPISRIIERIEQYRVGRRAPVLAPRLPLGDAPAGDNPARISSFDVITDATGRAISATDTVAPWITGMLLTGPQSGPLASFSSKTATALRQHQPILSAALELTGAKQISGAWRLDATPVFTQPRGGFAGYRCRLRRPVIAAVAQPARDSHADKMRQVLHELRTPVGAIQGFAEIIQQQMFGPAPHEYRAHAASIAVDAARLLAGFDEIDRLARLESDNDVLADGETDLRTIVSDTLRRLASVLGPRDAGFEFDISGTEFTVAIAQDDAQQLIWRVLATVAGALGAGEKIDLNLQSYDGQIRMTCDLPAPLKQTLTAAKTNQPRRPVVSAGMFGPPFAFRLAHAEAQAAGGAMTTERGTLTLTLPVLGHAHNDRSRIDRKAAQQ